MARSDDWSDDRENAGKIVKDFLTRPAKPDGSRVKVMIGARGRANALSDSRGRGPPALDGSARLDHCAAMNGHFLIVGICRGIIR
jgi:hypothetical protein